jgi:signal transduction histidine kinase
VLEYTCARPEALKARILIERQVAQMTRLVDDLLDLSRIRHGQLTLQRKRVDLCVVVAHATATVALTMQERKQRMSACVPPVWLHADSERLKQVLVNLLFNAAQYGRITLGGTARRRRSRPHRR